MALSKTSPNQRIVLVQKEKLNKGEKNKPYLIIYRDSLEQACRDLKGNGLRLYLYLAENKDGYEFAFSSDDCAKKMGISRDSVLDQFHNLESAGYIEKTSGNNYIFKEKLDEEINTAGKRLLYDENSDSWQPVNFNFLLATFNGDYDKARNVWKYGTREITKEENN